jgi:hypothetical protein
MRWGFVSAEFKWEIFTKKTAEIPKHRNIGMKDWRDKIPFHPLSIQISALFQTTHSTADSNMVGQNGQKV